MARSFLQKVLKIHFGACSIVLSACIFFFSQTQFAYADRTQDCLNAVFVKTGEGETDFEFDFDLSPEGCEASFKYILRGKWRTLPQYRHAKGLIAEAIKQKHPYFADWQIEERQQVSNDDPWGQTTVVPDSADKDCVRSDSEFKSWLRGELKCD